MKTLFFIIALVVILAGYNVLTTLNGAAVISGNTECDDTMGLIANPEETTFKDSIFVASTVQQRTLVKSDQLSKQWVTVGSDSCSNNVITEWSCTSSRAGAKAISGKIQCKYGCTLGHCILPTCYDPDIAQPYTIAATTIGIKLDNPLSLGVPPRTQDAQEYTDYCTPDLILTEYSCVQLGGGSYVKSLQKSCKSLGKDFKCVEGRCVSPELILAQEHQQKEVWD